MAITKAKKETILTKLEGVKTDAESIVFVRFRGMAVKDSTQMRAKMRDEGVGYFVAKKTLMRRAFGEAYTGEMPNFDGEIAIAYSTDAIKPAQSVKEFAEKFKDQLEIVGGVFQGVWKTKEEMTEIASIPPLPVLYGMFANFLQQPVQGIALVIQAVAEAKEKQAA